MSCPYSLDPSSCGSKGTGIPKAVAISGMTGTGAARRTKGRTGWLRTTTTVSMSRAIGTAHAAGSNMITGGITTGIGATRRESVVRNARTAEKTVEKTIGRIVTTTGVRPESWL
jgi:hypothetical protein